MQEFHVFLPDLETNVNVIYQFPIWRARIRKDVATKQWLKLNWRKRNIKLLQVRSSAISKRRSIKLLGLLIKQRKNEWSFYAIKSFNVAFSTTLLRRLSQIVTIFDIAVLCPVGDAQCRTSYSPNNFTDVEIKLLSTVSHAKITKKYINYEQSVQFTKL